MSQDSLLLLRLPSHHHLEYSLQQYFSPKIMPAAAPVLQKSRECFSSLTFIQKIVKAAAVIPDKRIVYISLKNWWWQTTGLDHQGEVPGHGGLDPQGQGHHREGHCPTSLTSHAWKQDCLQNRMQSFMENCTAVLILIMAIFTTWFNPATGNLYLQHWHQRSWWCLGDICQGSSWSNHVWWPGTWLTWPSYCCMTADLAQPEQFKEGHGYQDSYKSSVTNQELG